MVKKKLATKKRTITKSKTKVIGRKKALLNSKTNELKQIKGQLDEIKQVIKDIKRDHPAIKTENGILLYLRTHIFSLGLKTTTAALLAYILYTRGKKIKEDLFKTYDDTKIVLRNTNDLIKGLRTFLIVSGYIKGSEGDPIPRPKTFFEKYFINPDYIEPTSKKSEPIDIDDISIPGKY